MSHYESQYQYLPPNILHTHTQIIMYTKDGQRTVISCNIHRLTQISSIIRWLARLKESEMKRYDILQVQSIQLLYIFSFIFSFWCFRVTASFLDWSPRFGGLVCQCCTKTRTFGTLCGCHDESHREAGKDGRLRAEAE